MKYITFHALFNLPPLVILMLMTLDRGLLEPAALPLLLLCAIVVAFTFPWDNWAIVRGIWDFPDDRIVARILRVPLEEAAFFLLQTLNVALLTTVLISAGMHSERPEADLSTPILISIAAIMLAWLGSRGLAGRYREADRSRTYAVHLLYWFVPVLALQWLFGYAILNEYLGEIVMSTMAAGTYYVAADVVAVRQGIWFFDHGQTTGTMFLRILPWEEVAFFFLTSLLVAQSMVLLMP